MNIKLYGIPNCDTVKRARAWLGAHGVAYRFHDYKREGVPADALAAWQEGIGWERLLNRSGTTWRRLPEAERAAMVDAESARAVMVAQPSVIRRPVVEWGDGNFSVGFDAADWAARIDAR